MPTKLQEIKSRRIVRDVKRRKGLAPGSWIGTADAYLKTLEGCGAGGYCPTHLAGKGVDWSAVIKHAADTLVYHDPEMVHSDPVAQAGFKAAGLVDMPPNAIMVFSGVFSSKRKDRDGDILEPKGALVDPKMPLLWQHMPFEPIGKMLVLTGTSDTKVTGQCAIADTALGRDAAVLVEFGALRISHGFRPLEFEPLNEKDGPGWHVVKYEMMEVSLVSVPSNVDAVITASSREKLHHPLVKNWAGVAFAERPAMASVAIDVAALAKNFPPAPSVLGAKNTAEGSPAPQAVKGACACGATSHAAAGAKALEDAESKTVEDFAALLESGRLTKEEARELFGQAASKATKLAGNVLTKEALNGSWQWVESKLAVKVRAFMSLNGNNASWCYLLATYDNYGVICACYDDGMSWTMRYFQAGWSMVDGEPTWMGTPSECEVTTEVRAHADAILKEYTVAGMKGGRTLSQKNEDAIADAMADCDEIAKMDDVPRPAKTLAKAASSKLKAVIDTAKKKPECDEDEEDDEDEDDKKSVEPADDMEAYLAELL